VDTRATREVHEGLSEVAVPIVAVDSPSHSFARPFHGETSDQYWSESGKHGGNLSRHVVMCDSYLRGPEDGMD